ncbi:protein PLANT CADMIUM RESISTANCE 2-like [Cornus florida]|uniref:protein PLANT CADMIUM RESISTANCE 2-like n=1 Tax=Cornus florida TaxID=4283 RepID=UPI00289D76D1|nr:protein PLANT CADMIUM RESISTANCE 2-like [Cornus florida]
MKSSNPNDFQKFSSSPPPSAPLYVGVNQPMATGVPVSSTDHFYSNNTHAPIHHQPKSEVPWSTGLCDCFDDVPNCCMTCWCPCVTFGRVAEIVDRGSTSCAVSGAIYTLIAVVTGCACCFSCCYRSKMRHQYMLQENPCGDCLVHCCCESCALCQEYRELKNRGVDMTIGWQGNAERQNRGMELPPVFGGGMSRS